MELKIGHRLLLLNLLPKEGTIDILRVVLELRSTLGFSEEEHAATFLRLEDNRFVWGDPEWEEHGFESADAAEVAVDQPVDISIGERAFDVIKSVLNHADRDGKLRVEFIPLYEHFVEKKEWQVE